MKKRPHLISTIILTIFLIIFLVASSLFIGLSWQDVRDMAADEKGVGVIIAVFGSLAVIVAIAVEVILVIGSLICLPFAIGNFKSGWLFLRIYSFILDAGFLYVLISSIIKLVNYFSGI